MWGPAGRAKGGELETIPVGYQLGGGTQIPCPERAMEPETDAGHKAPQRVKEPLKERAVPAWLCSDEHGLRRQWVGSSCSSQAANLRQRSDMATFDEDSVRHLLSCLHSASAPARTCRRDHCEVVRLAACSTTEVTNRTPRSRPSRIRRTIRRTARSRWCPRRRAAAASGGTTLMRPVRFMGAVTPKGHTSHFDLFPVRSGLIRQTCQLRELSG